MELRKTGIEAIGDIPWGTHISYIYSSENGNRCLNSTLSPFIKEGLSHNELCVWIYSQNSCHHEIVEALEKHIPHVNTYITSGQLIILPHTKWYLEDGTFIEPRVNKKWISLLKYALDNGYEGLRAIGDIAWLPKSFAESFANYEKNVNSLISNLPFIAICLYDKNKVDLLQFAEIIKSHYFTIVEDSRKIKLLKNADLMIKCGKLLHYRADYKDLIRRLPAGTLIEDDNKMHYYNKKSAKNADVNETCELFFSNISHELRTPLNVILAAIQLMDKLKENTPKDDRERKYLGIIKQNCYRLLRLVNNLIDITKLDSNYFELDLKNCDIVALVEDVTLSAADYIKSKGIKLQFDTFVEEKVIACDPDQIERIILNLLSNAVKFTPPGGNIWVKVFDLRNRVLICVKDNGVGIPKDKQKYIFDRFQQVEYLFNRHHEGSGIGLALVKSLVEKHGGKISVSSEVGKGSTFIIELPSRTLSQAECGQSICPCITGHTFLERANIEFSDIYT